MAANDPTQVKLEIGANVIQTGDGYDWKLTHITDHKFMIADVEIGKYANRDGGHIKKRRYEPREPKMYIQSKLHSKEQIDATWLQLKSYMSCKRDATLTIYEHGVARVLSGVISDVKKRDDDMKWNVPADIRVVFTAPDPWYLSDDITKPFASEIPLIYGPLTIMSTGLTGGVISSGNSITFDVEGDDTPPFLLTLTATGAIVNPKITNAHGLYVKAIKTLAAGDVLTIYTGVKPYLRCNGAWCSRDKGGNFFELDIGTNTLTISADSGIGNMTNPQINYKERYQ